MAEEKKDPWLNYLALTTVIFAVCATLSTFKGGGYSTRSVLSQAQASDQWAFFQAKSIKKNAYDIAARQGGPLSDEFAREARRYGTESGQIQDKAEALEHQVEQRLHEAERHEHRHHILTTAVTFLHVAIAITTIAIITKGRRWPWHMGLALGAAGVALAGYAYL